jgi:hypothetical protein
MAKEAGRWRSRVEPFFGFLVDLGFSRVDVDDTSFWETWVEYGSLEAAIRVRMNRECGHSEVSLIRLVEGMVPAYPIWITSDRIDWVLLDNVLEVRRPDLFVQARLMTGLGGEQLDRQLAFWSSAVREVVPDFLAGDLGAIDEASELIRERVRLSPQQVQVWLPGESPAGAEADQIRDVASTVPPEVGVVARRYRRDR